MLRNCRTVVGCLLLTAAVNVHAAQEPVALVTEVSGTATLAQKPDGGALEVLRELRVGAVMTLGSDARVIVVHTASGAVYDLSGPGRFRVHGLDIEPLNGARAVRHELPAQIKSFQLKPLSAMQANIVMRGGSPVWLDGPNGGVLGIEELTYRIRGNVIAPRVEVTEAGGDTIIGLHDASASFNLAGGDALRPGVSYLLLVKGADDRGKAVELSSRFWLIASDAATRLKAIRPVNAPTTTDLIVYALALESAGATSTAQDTWRAINERR